MIIQGLNLTAVRVAQLSNWKVILIKMRNSHSLTYFALKPWDAIYLTTGEKTLILKKKLKDGYQTHNQYLNNIFWCIKDFK